MIRIDAMWLSAEPVDMRAGAERLLARVVQVFGAAQAHHGYLFANARANRLLAAVDSLLGKEKAFGTPTGWERWMNELREARACWPWP